MATNPMKDLTFDETHNWYNNLVKRTGWVMLSIHNGESKDAYLKDIMDIIPKINKMSADLYDNDKKRDLTIMRDNLKDLHDIVSKYKNNTVKRRTSSGTRTYKKY
jgi:hypothetical protein